MPIVTSQWGSDRAFSKNSTSEQSDISGLVMDPQLTVNGHLEYYLHQNNGTLYLYTSGSIFAQRYSQGQHVDCWPS